MNILNGFILCFIFSCGVACASQEKILVVYCDPNSSGVCPGGKSLPPLNKKELDDLDCPREHALTSSDKKALNFVVAVYRDIVADGAGGSQQDLCLLIELYCYIVALSDRDILDTYLCANYSERNPAVQHELARIDSLDKEIFGPEGKVNLAASLLEAAKSRP